MRKRILMTILCASMIASMLTACGSSSKGSSSKTETSKKETVSVEKEDTKEEDIEKEKNQSETVEENYSYNSFWKNFKILADGNEIILGETTLQDMENLGFNIRENETIIANDNSSMKVEANCRNEDDNWDDFSLRIIFSMELNGGSGNVSLGGITPNSSPEEIFQTLGIPDYYDGKDNLEYMDGDVYEWIYINKDIVLKYTFYLCNDEDNDLVINVYGGDMGKSESEYYTENRISEGLECGEENFRKLYPSYFGEDSVEQEAPVASDDKTITIEGKQITLEEISVEEILAMFPEMEYKPNTICKYEEISQSYQYSFYLEDEESIFYIRATDFDVFNQETLNKYGLDRIELQGELPEVDISKYIIDYVEFIDLKDGDNIRDNCTMKGITIGMDEEKLSSIFPELHVTQRTAIMRYEFMDEEKRIVYRVYADIDSHKICQFDIGCY